METLLNILSELHPEVDFETETGLIVTKPETLNDLATRIFHSVEKED